MDNLQIAVRGATPARSSADYWIKLTTDPPEPVEGITKAQLADAIDNVFGVENHCTGEQTDDPFDPSGTETPEQRLQAGITGDNCFETAALLRVAAQCSTARRTGLSNKKTVYVHWSSKDILANQYSFKTTSDISPFGPNRGASLIQIIVDFTDADYAPVYRYADSEEVIEQWGKTPPQWIGEVLIGSTIVDSSIVLVGWSNGKIVLNQPVSGRLIVLLPIQYDIFEVSIPGVLIGDKRNFTATAYAFSDLLDSPAELALVDTEDADATEGSDCDLCGGSAEALVSFGGASSVDGSTTIRPADGQPCLKRIDWEVRNRCDTTLLIDSGTRFEDTECPDKRELQLSYTDQDTPSDARITREEYIDSCCFVPSTGCLPCRKVTDNWGGGAPVLPSEQYWRDSFSGITRFVRVRPEDGCGKRFDIFSEITNCCLSIPDVQINKTSSAKIIAEGNVGTIYYTGGNFPVNVSLNGTGFWLNSTHTIKSMAINSRSFFIYAHESCGSCKYTVIDSCQSSDDGWVKSTNGVWVEIYNTLKDTALNVTCDKDNLRITDDFCGFSSTVTCLDSCQGTEDQDCPDPVFSPGSAKCRVEGKKILEWVCP